jgi:hypothetical protein
MAKASSKEQSAFLNEYAEDGFEGISIDDVAIPFLRILQPLSPQCMDETAPEYIPTAKPGMFFNTVTQRLYGRSVEVIPIKYEKIWLEWLPERGGLAGRHTPNSIPVDKSKFSEWKLDNGNIIQEHYVFFCLVPEFLDDGPVAFSLTSTGIKHAKNWNTQIMLVQLPNKKRAPFYSSVWELTTVQNKNDQGTWWQIGEKQTSIKRVRFITETEFLDYVQPIRNSLSSRVLNFEQLEDTREERKQIAQADKEELKQEAPF